MAKIYTPDEIKIIADGGKILARVFSLLKQEIKEGTSLKYLDKLAHEAEPGLVVEHVQMFHDRLALFG